MFEVLVNIIIKRVWVFLIGDLRLGSLVIISFLDKEGVCVCEYVCVCVCRCVCMFVCIYGGYL